MGCASSFAVFALHFPRFEILVSNKQVTFVSFCIESMFINILLTLFFTEEIYFIVIFLMNVFFVERCENITTYFEGARLCFEGWKPLC